LASGMVKYPQQLTNVRLPRKIDITTHPDVEEAVMRAEASLGESGRVLLRNSGTEPLLRIMVEAEDESDAERHAHAIAFAVKGALR
jgi:phosphoglucosamine mutase